MKLSLDDWIMFPFSSCWPSLEMGRSGAQVTQVTQMPQVKAAKIYDTT